MAEQSLFGITPEALQASRAAALQQEALQYAKLDPFQRATAGIYQGANQLGGVVGGMLGGQDPELMRIKQRQSLMQEINLSEPSSIKQGIEAAMKSNDYALANELNTRYQASVKAALEARRTESEIAKNLREKEGADPIQQILRTGRFTPASVAEKKETGDPTVLTLVEKPGSKDTIKEVGTAVGSGKAVYTFQTADGVQQITFETGPDGKQVMKPYVGPVDRTTAKVSATASNKGADAGAEEIAKLDAKRLAAAAVSSDKALNQAGVLQTLLNTPQPISGSGAPARVAALRVFSTIGLTSPKDTVALQNADTFNSLAGERVLSFIKELGTNPTDTDREFARTIGPALEKGTKTNQDLVTYLLGRAKDTVNVAADMERHFYENNYSLKGFKSPLMKNLESPPASSLTTEQLLKRREQLQKGKP